MRLVYALALVPALAAADPGPSTDAAEYPAFRLGGTLGMPAGATSGAVALGAGTAGGFNLDALLKAGFAITEDYARVFIVAESTQLQVPSESEITSAGGTITTPLLEANTFFSSIGFKFALGTPPRGHDAEVCCTALAMHHQPLSADESSACDAAGIPHSGQQVCGDYTPSTFFWGGGIRVLAPRSGGTDNVGAAGEIYGQVRGEHVDGFVSASGVLLQDWHEDLDKVDMPSVIRHAGLYQGTVTGGLQAHFDALNFGLLTRLGCQQWSLDSETAKACSFDFGAHLNLHDLAKNINQLRFYLGVERVAGADQLQAAGLQDHAWTFILRVEPALSALQH